MADRRHKTQQRNQRRYRPKYRNKRGIVMLVVVGLLVLFVLIGITFILVAGQNELAAKGHVRRKFLKVQPTKFLDAAIYQLLRDTPNRRSSLFGQSLLRDLYGNDGIIGQCSAVPNGPLSGVAPVVTHPSSNMIMINFIDPDQPTFQTPVKQPFNQQFSELHDYYAGCVITMLTGPAKGRSSRVLRYIPAILPNDPGVPIQVRREPNNSVKAGRLFIEMFDGDRTVLPRLNDIFLINGRPFNGTGYGYQPFANAFQPGGITPPGMTVVDDSVPSLPAGSNYGPVSLTPHLAGYKQLPRRFHTAGADESYDAWDHQNMHLAMIVRDPAFLPDERQTNSIFQLPIGPRLSAPLIDPSFVRAPLINYWNQTLSQSPAYQQFWDPTQNVYDPSPQVRESYRDFRRKIFFRPMPWDHPGFTGGNPSMAVNVGTGQFTWNWGPDGEWGVAGFDDNGDGFNNDIGEAGAPNSDDFINNDRGFISNFVLNRRWDVDNDKDGFPDSVWIDIGLPIRTTEDGRKYRPLVAILCTDLDNRLHVNATGDNAHVSPSATWGVFRQDQLYRLTPAGFAQPTLKWLNREMPYAVDPTHQQQNIFLPKGLGFGPSEITLAHIFAGTGPNAHLVASQESLNFMQARMGFDSPIPTGVNGRPGRVNGTEDDASFLVHFGSPNRYFPPLGGGNPDPPTLFSTPPDSRGHGTYALDLAGHIAYRSFRQGAANSGPISLLPNGETVDRQYESDPNYYQRGPTARFRSKITTAVSGDMPVTVAELERLLRYNDIDSHSLPKRLERLAPNTFTIVDEALRNRNLLGFGSHIPTSIGFAPRERRNDPNATVVAGNPDPRQVEHLGRPMPGRDGVWGNRNLPNWADNVLRAFDEGSDDYVLPYNLLDLYAERIRRTIRTQSGGQHPNDYAVNQIMTMLVPWEILHGERFNINRVFGNGQNDNAPLNPNNPQAAENYVADELLEQIGHRLGNWNESALPVRIVPNNRESLSVAQTRSLPFAHHNDDPLGRAIRAPLNGGTRLPVFTRQIFARHLYTLAMLLTDEEYMNPINVTPQTNIERELRARQIAQWVINVIDYRDADADMTPFEYDVNPFNGWDCDDDYSTTVFSDPNVMGAPQAPPVYPQNPAQFDAIHAFDRINPYTQQDERRLVWGSERPQLLISETLAFHDRRVKDTAEDGVHQRRRGTMQNDDDDLDQFRIPQGSLFIELYCPRNSGWHEQQFYQNLYFPLPFSTTVSPKVLNLRRLAPASYDRQSYPIWRMAITERHLMNGSEQGPQGSNPPRNGPVSDQLLSPKALLEDFNPLGNNSKFRNNDAVAFDATLTRFILDPATQMPLDVEEYVPTDVLSDAVRHGHNSIQGINPSFDPLNPPVVGNQNQASQPPLKLERFIWFTSRDPYANNLPQAYRIFFNRMNWDINVEPGGYCVVGPRSATTIGNRAVQPENNQLEVPAIRLEPLVRTLTYPFIPGSFEGIHHRNFNQEPLTPASQWAGDPRIRYVPTMVAQTYVPQGANGWNASGVLDDEGVGINISEPLPNGQDKLANPNYYREPTHRTYTANVAGNNKIPLDAYDDFANPMMTIPDTPFDDGTNDLSGFRWGGAAPTQGVLDPDPLTGLLDDPAQGSGAVNIGTGTYRDARTVLLQRLAIVNQAWHPTLNPYMTVDWAPIDLTLFNGEDRKDLRNPAWDPADGQWDPLDEDPDDTQSAQGDFRLFTISRQRGQRRQVLWASQALEPNANFWPPVFDHPSRAVAVNPDPSRVTPGTTDNYVRLTMQNTLGYVNTPVGVPRYVPGPSQAGSPNTVEQQFEYLGTPAEPVLTNPSVTPAYAAWPWPIVQSPGSGQQAPVLEPSDPLPKPAPLFMWADRPFISPMEIMFVPKGSPSRLLFEASRLDYNNRMPNPPPGPLAGPPFNPRDMWPQGYEIDETTENSEFGNYPNTAFNQNNGIIPVGPLFNFFRSTSRVSGATTFNNAIPELHRLFDVIETPAPFAGSDHFISPLAFVGTTGIPANRSNLYHFDYGSATFWAPFNKTSRFALPGRINLNTISDSKVFEGLMKAFPEMDPTLNANFFLRFLENRRGHSPPATPTAPIVQNGAPQYGHFLPSAAHPSIVGNPYRGVSGSDLMTVYGAGLNAAALRKGVNAGLLRSAGPRPMFVPDPAGPNGQSVHQPPYQQPGPSELRRPYRDQDRNPFFRYQGLTRLANLVSNQSNVFAIWVTVGYFELEPVFDPNGPAPDKAHPEGYTLGQEVGIDEGKVVRHRGFYIIDRSIPVAFVPGQNHNVDRAIVLRRRIE